MPLRASIAVATLGLALSVPSASASTRPPECDNDKDDDRDGLVDLADSGCLSLVDYFEGAMTRRFATSYARFRVSVEFGDGTLATQRRVRISCRGGRSDYRCRFRLRQRFSYRGVKRIYLHRFNDERHGVGEVEADRTLWFRGSCGAFPAGSPRPGPYPYAIRTRNVKCPSARRWIWNWYARGEPMPSRYNCLLRSSPATARCEAGRRVFAFKYPE
jgi:hypothetical protein